jgi:hypothetical protein
MDYVFFVYYFFLLLILNKFFIFNIKNKLIWLFLNYLEYNENLNTNDLLIDLNFIQIKNH